MPNKRADGLVMGRLWLPGELWTLFGNVTFADGTDRTKDLINYIRWRTGEPDAKLPTPATRAGSGNTAQRPDGDQPS